MILELSKCDKKLAIGGVFVFSPTHSQNKT
jgi:hypothetical protein